MFDPRGSKLQTSRRTGNVVVLVAVSLVAFVGICGLVIDGGQLMAERRQAQNAADAAALAAATDLYNGVPPGLAKPTGVTYATRHGYSDEAVDIAIPPNTGPHRGDTNFVEVKLTVDVPTFFIKVVYPPAAQVKVRAVAGLDRAPASGAGLLGLNGGASGAMTLSGSATINVNGSNLGVSSSSATALTGSGSAKITAPTIDITGNYTLSSTSQLIGTVRTGAPASSDPLASIPAPDPNAQPLRSASKLNLVATTATLQPGRYVGGIAMSSGANVTLQPGIYYIDDGAFTVSSSTLTGNGVMIYAERTFGLSGSSPVVLSPPTSGTYQGLSIFQDRNPVSPYPVGLSGGSNLNLSGTIYAPKARVTLSGTSGVANIGSQIIADMISMSGFATLNINWNPDTVAQKGSVYLVE